MTEATAPDLRKKIARVITSRVTFQYNSAGNHPLVGVDKAADAILALLPAPAPLGDTWWLEGLEAAAKKASPVWGHAGHQKHVVAFHFLANPEAVLRLIAIARAAGAKQ